jgi:putative ABC transport system permease protein
MLGFHLRMAWRGLRRQPGLSAMMVVAFALAVGAEAASWAVYDTVTAHPYDDRQDVVFHVQVDDRDPTLLRQHNELIARSGAGLMYLPWRDWQALRRSGITSRETGIVLARMPVGEGTERAQLVDPDFFDLFGARFRSGRPFRGDAAEVVLNGPLARRLFGDADPIGRTIEVSGEAQVVTGVLEDFDPRPRVYDPAGFVAFAPQIFLPVTRAPSLRPRPEIAVAWRPRPPGYDAFLASDEAWVQFWVELPDAARVQAFRAFVARYVAEQRAAGRLRDTPADPLWSLREWQARIFGTAPEAQLLLGLSDLLLVACGLSLMRMHFARALVRAPEVAAHRALGAPRRAVFLQSILESQLVGIGGSLLGLGLGATYNAGIRWLFPSFGVHLALSGVAVGATLATAAVASLLIGVVVAWRLARPPPVLFARGR